MRAIRLNIFKSKYGDSSNGGISSKYNDVLLPCRDGNIDLDKNTDLPVVELKHIFVNNESVYYVSPIDENNNQYMFGGCFVYSSDNRFSFTNPIRLYDRIEK